MQRWRASVTRVVAWGKATRVYRTIDRFNDAGGNIISAGMSYQALFATFAALWVGFGVFGFILDARPALQEAIVKRLNLLVPGLIGDSTGEGAVSVALLLTTRTLDWTSFAAAIALLWVAISWFTGTRRAVRLIFRLPRAYSTALKMKIRDAMLAFGFGIAILLSASLSVMSTQFLHGFFVRFGITEPYWLLDSVTNVSILVAMIIFDTLVLVAIVRILAGIQVDKLNLWVGALMGGVALAGIKLLGSALLGGATSNPLLASFAILIGMLIWFNLISRVVLLTVSWIASGVSAEQHRAMVAAQRTNTHDNDWI